MPLVPVTLEGRWARLEPLAHHQAADLAAVAGDAEIWRYLPAGLMTIEQIRAWVDDARWRSRPPGLGCPSRSWTGWRAGRSAARATSPSC
jgi:hypothetical protein